jgi:hypothetical protein
VWKVNEPERRFLRNYDRLWRIGLVIRRRSWTSSNPDFKPAILVKSIIHPEKKKGPVILAQRGLGRPRHEVLRKLWTWIGSVYAIPIFRARDGVFG